MSRKVVFCPCVGSDIEQRVLALFDHGDHHFIFNDIHPSIQKVESRLPNGLSYEFNVGDANKVVEQLNSPIDVLFHCMDSGTEGGSGVWVLGSKTFLPRALAAFNSEGGTIVSDGSNSRGSTLERMLRPNGLGLCGFNLRLSDTQRFTHETSENIRKLGKRAHWKHLMEFLVTPI